MVTADINKKLISVKISISFGHDITGKINLKQKRKVVADSAPAPAPAHSQGTFQQ